MELLSYLSEFLIPILIFYVVATGIFAGKPVYEDFTKGAKEGLGTVMKIMPTMIALMVAVNVLRASGFLEFVANLCQPLAVRLCFPAPLVPLAIVKSFSGSAATGLLIDLLKEYGADSMIGKMGAIMLSSTETIFYTISLYFVTARIKHTRYTLAGCLISTLAGVIASVCLAPLI